MRPNKQLLIKYWLAVLLIPLGLPLFWSASMDEPGQPPAPAAATPHSRALASDNAPGIVKSPLKANPFWVRAPNLQPAQLPKPLQGLPGTSLQLTVDPQDLQIGDLFEITFPDQPQTRFQLRLDKRASLWGSTILRGTLLTPESQSAVLTLREGFISATFETPAGLREGFGEERTLWLYDPDTLERDASPNDFIIPGREGET